MQQFDAHEHAGIPHEAAGAAERKDDGHQKEWQPAHSEHSCYHGNGIGNMKVLQEFNIINIIMLIHVCSVITKVAFRLSVLAGPTSQLF